MTRRQFIRCQRLFTGLEDDVRRDQTLVVEGSVFTHVGPSAEAPKPGPDDECIDAGGQFVMPGLVDVHTHLVFGNARSEEDIDFWVTPEFRALRGLFFAQHVLAAGYTSIAVPGDAGHCSIAVRDAIRAGLFDGPRIAASSCVIANRHSLNDWFPDHVGTPEYATHAYGKEAVLQAARAGVDVIIHAFFADEECADAIVQSGSAVAPTLTFLRNNIEFSRDHEPSVQSGYRDMQRRVVEIGCRNLRRLREAGVRFMTGSDAGFAHTPYGEWHAREIDILVDWLGFSPAQALRAATSVSASLMPRGRPGTPEAAGVGAIEAGRQADFLFVRGDPLADVRVLLDVAAIAAVHIGGRRIEVQRRPYDRFKVTDLSSLKWTDIYTRERVAALQGSRGHAADESPDPSH